MKLYVVSSYGSGVVCVVGVFSSIESVELAMHKTRRYCEFEEITMDEISEYSKRLDKQEI